MDSSLESKDFLAQHTPRKPDDVWLVKNQIPQKKKKCACKKGIGIFDVLEAALAAYGLWKLGFLSYELISGLFQKEIKSE
jgi:hypothetical protein